MYSQDIDLEHKSDLNEQSVYYRPGIRFQTSDVNSGGSSLQNLVESSSIHIEMGQIGRFGGVYIDGATTSAMIGLDGVVLRYPSINGGRMFLYMTPFDFASKADIYKQNLVPYGVGAGSLLDFRIPVNFKDEVTVNIEGSTMGELYTKIQGEKTFKNGSTVYGILGDFGLMDYYYGVNGGKDFATYDGSTYQRASFLSKTVWNEWEFLLSHTIFNSFNENGGGKPSCEILNNSLVTSIKYTTDTVYFNMNYLYYNLMSEHLNRPITNDYNNHTLVTTVGIRDEYSHFRYNIGLSYNNRLVEDGMRASVSNYLNSPEFGENDFNLVTEVDFILFDKNDDKPFNMIWNIALNQILTTEGNYTPVPSFSWGTSHQNGFYLSLDVSRVYEIPDFTAQYGFGNFPNLITLQPKDGIRSGIEIGKNSHRGRIYGNVAYSWLDSSFRLEGIQMQNVDNVTSVAAEIGGEVRQIVKDVILTYFTSMSYNYEKDGLGRYTTFVPIIKGALTFKASSIDEIWDIKFLYKITSGTADTRFSIDYEPRHFMDIGFRYRWFTFNVLNLLNQSYLPRPNNIYVPYNPGIRAEMGVQLKF